MKIIQKNKKLLAAIGISSALLSGCSTINPYTGQEETSRATIGTGLGALSGALIGGLAGGERGAIIGGAVGAMGGGVIGNEMDKQNAELRRCLVGTGVQVDRCGDYIRLVMASDVTFNTNQSDVRCDFYPTLRSVAIVLRKYCRTNVVITGYTDNVGEAAYNQSLSERRAESVGSFLISQGVSPNRIFTSGRGKRDPIASNASPEGRSMNRRVEITLRPR